MANFYFKHRFHNLEYFKAINFIHIFYGSITNVLEVINFILFYHILNKFYTITCLIYVLHITCTIF